MNDVVTTKLIQIGNSQGVRLPKAAIKTAGLTGELTLEVRAGELVLRAKKQPRDGWAEAYALMAQRGDNVLSDDDRAWTEMPNKFDEEEWQWDLKGSTSTS